MYLPRIAGIYALIPTTMLLVVSFFVLFSVRKAEGQGLKTFGLVLAVCLWISAALVFSAGAYILAKGDSHMMKMKCPGMMQGGMKSPMMQHPMTDK